MLDATQLIIYYISFYIELYFPLDLLREIASTPVSKAFCHPVPCTGSALLVLKAKDSGSLSRVIKGRLDAGFKSSMTKIAYVPIDTSWGLSPTAFHSAKGNYQVPLLARWLI